MAVINRKYDFLYLAEGYTGSRVTRDALLKLPDSKEIGSHHHSVPQLLNDKSVSKEELRKLTTFSVVRHPLDILSTQIAKSNRSISWWLIKRYQDYLRGYPFYFHYGCNRTLRYEDGLDKVLKEITSLEIILPRVYVTTNKIPWQELFKNDDLEFAYATIVELFTFGYVPWHLKYDRTDFIKKYLKKYEIH